MHTRLFGMRRVRFAVVLLLLPACAGSAVTSSSTTERGSSTSAAASVPPSITSPPTSLFGDQGVAVVDLGGVRHEFRLSECRVGNGVFVAEGDDEGGSVLYLHHASPPLRQPPEPSMSSLVITGSLDAESAPASVTFETYDVARRVAAGTAWLTTDVDRPTASFSVECV